jgi:hypothetical protein
VPAEASLGGDGVSQPDQVPEVVADVAGVHRQPPGVQPHQPVCPAAVLGRVGACAAGAGRVDVLRLTLLDAGTLSVSGRGRLVGRAVPTGVQGGN